MKGYIDRYLFLQITAGFDFCDECFVMRRTVEKGKRKYKSIGTSR